MCGALARERRACLEALARPGRGPPRPRLGAGVPPGCAGWRWRADETPPRGGAALASGQRRPPTLGPRTRQAPAGHQAGGPPPTASRRSHRRSGRAPALPLTPGDGRKKLANSGSPFLTSAVIATPKLRRGPHGTDSRLPQSVRCGPSPPAPCSVGYAHDIAGGREIVQSTWALASWPLAQRANGPPWGLATRESLHSRHHRYLSG